MSTPVLTDARQIDWSAAKEAAQRIVRRCEDAGFTAPEALDVIRRNIQAVCLELDAIAKALLITPRRSQAMTAPITILAALGISALCLGIVGRVAHLIDVVLRRRAARRAMRGLGRLVGSSTTIASPGLSFSAAVLIVLGWWIAFTLIMIGTACADRLDCGEDRAAIKLGTDVEARRIALLPVPATIAELVLRPAPARLGSRRTADEHATERTVYTVHATITGYKLERDGDYHVVLADEHGTTMIVELPDPGCAATGAWPEQIRTARAAFRRLLADHMLMSPGVKLHRAAVGVTVTGVGFFDRIHGQVGVARNGIELHPVLAIESGGAL